MTKAPPIHLPDVIIDVTDVLVILFCSPQTCGVVGFNRIKTLGAKRSTHIGPGTDVGNVGLTLVTSVRHRSDVTDGRSGGGAFVDALI